MNLKDHIHLQSNKSGYVKKPSLPLKLLVSSTPNSPNQIIEGGIKQKAFKKSKVHFLPLFLHIFIIQELQLPKNPVNKYTQIEAVY